MGDCHYLHSTEYKFSASAFNEVIRTFKEIINDVSVRCVYLVKSDVFSIVCPPSLGAYADSLFADVIADFLQKEKEQDEPRIQSLMQIAMDGKDATATEAAPSPAATTVLQHSVNAEGHNGCFIKMFTLDQLPDQLFQRSLGPDIKPDALQARKQGLTCRVVRHDLQIDQYIFNARLGEALPRVGSTAEAALLGLAIFPHVRSQSDQPIANPNANANATAPIQVVTIIQNPGVSKWLHDSAEPVKQISPDVPTSRPWATTANGTHPPVQPPHRQEQWQNTSNSRLTEHDPNVPPGQLVVYQPNSINGTTNLRQRAAGTENREPFPSYGPQYAAVDEIGLTGTAADQASWEIQNYVPKETTRHGSGSYVRQSSFSCPQHDSKTSNQQSGQRDVLQESNTTVGSSSSAASKTITNAPQTTTSGEPSWTNKVVQPAPTGNSLVDDSPTKRTQSDKKSHKTSTKNERSSRRPAPLQKNKSRFSFREDWVPPSPTTETKPFIESLIDFGEDDGNYVTQGQLDKPMIPPGGYEANSEPLVPIKAFSKCPAPPIVERLIDFEEPILRHTMKQQARNSKKKASSFLKAPPKAVAQLPKPEPWIPVQRRGRHVPSDSVQVVKHQEENNSVDDHGSERCLTIVSSESDTVRAPRAAETTARHSDFIHGSFIRVQFGMALVWKDDKFLKRGVFNPEELQQKLNVESYALHVNFVPKLTTSTSDACYLLDLVPGAISKITTTYEVEVRGSDGATSRFEFQASIAHHTAKVTSLAMLEERYRHYPYRVWDSHIGSYKTNDIVPDRVTEFINSIQTADPPSFYAQVPADGFTVEKVLALRTYEKILPLGVLHVVDVQELILESIIGKNFNIMVRCEEREEMIDQQRQWWESNVIFHCETSLTDVVRVIDELVVNMDGVGFHNSGPLFKRSVEVKKEEDNKFW